MATPLAFWDQVQATCDELTTTVGSHLLTARGTPAEEKQDGSLVTQFDRWSDQQLRMGLQSAFPDHGVLSEETTHVFPEADWCWIIDPIDGTTNFSRGIPLWAISLGLLYRGTPVYGYVYIPPLGDRFWGHWPGDSGLTMTAGAWLNGSPSTRAPKILDPISSLASVPVAPRCCNNPFPARCECWAALPTTCCWWQRAMP
jgi:myo-inositol-1(or 4)-monophosphatase